jgi:hypothetical protein
VLPDGDGNFTPSTLTLDDFSATLGLPTIPMDTFARSAFSNDFTVFGGVATGAGLLAVIAPDTAPQLSDVTTGGETYLDALNKAVFIGSYGSAGVLYADGSTLSFTAMGAAPLLPAAAPMLLVGLAGSAGRTPPRLAGARGSCGRGRRAIHDPRLAWRTAGGTLARGHPAGRDRPGWRRKSCSRGGVQA